LEEESDVTKHFLLRKKTLEEEILRAENRKVGEKMG